MTVEPQSKTNPHTKWCSHTRNHRAQTRETQRDHFTSPRKIRKNKGLSKTLGSSAAISFSLSNHQKVPNSLEVGDIYTRKTLLVRCENEMKFLKIGNVKGHHEMNSQSGLV